MAPRSQPGKELPARHIANLRVTQAASVDAPQPIPTELIALQSSLPEAATCCHVPLRGCLDMPFRTQSMCHSQLQCPNLQSRPLVINHSLQLGKPRSELGAQSDGGRNGGGILAQALVYSNASGRRHRKNRTMSGQCLAWSVWPTWSAQPLQGRHLHCCRPHTPATLLACGTRAIHCALRSCNAQRVRATAFTRRFLSGTVRWSIPVPAHLPLPSLICHCLVCRLP